MAQLPVRIAGGGTAYTEVDDVDLLWASTYRWHLTSNGYVMRSQRRGHDRKLIRIGLHREILGLKHGYPDLWADHANGDPLDNRRENLRAVTPSENAHNRKGQKKGRQTSRHRGVSWFTARNCWRVAVMVNGVRTVVGYFDDEDEAGRAAYDFYAENVPFANVTAPSGPGTLSDSPHDVQPPGPGRSAAVSDNSVDKESQDGHPNAGHS